MTTATATAPPKPTRPKIKRKTLTTPHCPLCDTALTPEEIKSLWGAYTSGQRKQAAGGRPPKPRCNCGAMTKDAARKINHRC